MHNQAGLIQLGKTAPIIAPSATLYVVTHPFWGDDKHPYIDDLERLLREVESPVLILDTWLNETMARCAQLQPKGSRYFLQNGWPLAVPTAGWKVAVNVIKAFKPEEVIFGGSQLNGNEKDGYWCCVGLTYKNLRDLVPNPRLEESLCDRV